MAIEIVDLAIENGDFPYFFVCLPEGNLKPLAGTWRTLEMSATHGDKHQPSEGYF